MQMARFVHAYARRTRLALPLPLLLPLVLALLVPLPLPLRLVLALLAEIAPPAVALVRLTRTLRYVGGYVHYLVLPVLKFYCKREEESNHNHTR
jgi:hypothetical protein